MLGPKSDELFLGLTACGQAVPRARPRGVHDLSGDHGGLNAYDPGLPICAAVTSLPSRESLTNPCFVGNRA